LVSLFETADIPTPDPTCGGSTGLRCYLYSLNGKWDLVVRCNDTQFI